VDCAVKNVDVAAEQKESMASVDDTDVLVAAVLVPVRHPLVTREAPTPRASVAQVDTCQFDRSVHLAQVCYIGARLVNLLHVK